MRGELIERNKVLRLEKENAELRAANEAAETELEIITSGKDKLQSRIEELEKENAELRSVLLHLWQWLPLNYRRFYGSDYSPAKAIIERLQEQSDEK